MTKDKKVHFQLLLFGVLLHSILTPRGQGHLLTFLKCHLSDVCQHFERASPLKLLANFI